MIFAEKNILEKLLDYEFARFLIVGFTTVLVDLICYLLFIYIGFETLLSKGVSFSFGTVFAYFANRSFTFQSSESGFVRFAVFTLLYLSSLVANVVSNEVVLKFTNHIDASLMIAFITATSLSATLNFLGMKYIVFKAEKSPK